MDVFTRILPLLVVTLTVACTSPPTGVSEERPGASSTPSPSSAEEGIDAEGSAGVGADGPDGPGGRSGRGDDADGKDTGTPLDTSGGPDSFSATTNDVLIGANFANVQHVSFGSTPPESTVTTTVKVVSLGGTTVSSVSVSSGTGTFRLVDNGCTGARSSGRSCQVRLTASPPGEGEHEGILEIGYTTADNKSRSTGVKMTVSGESAGAGRKSLEDGTTEPEVPRGSSTGSTPTTAG